MRRYSVQSSREVEAGRMGKDWRRHEGDRVCVRVCVRERERRGVKNTSLGHVCVRVCVREREREGG